MSAVAHIDEYKTGKFFSESFRGEMSWNGYENNVLLLNRGLDEQGIPQYTDLATALGADDVRDARGTAVFDFDRDGDLDIAINHNPGDFGAEFAPAVFLRNEIGQGRHWLQIELEGRTSNRDGIGAEVTVAQGEKTQLRHMTAGSSYASQHGHRLHFGFADDGDAVAVSVSWPSGEQSQISDVALDQIIRIHEDGKWEVIQAPTDGLSAGVSGE